MYSINCQLSCFFSSLYWIELFNCFIKKKSGRLQFFGSKTEYFFVNMRQMIIRIKFAFYIHIGFLTLNGRKKKLKGGPTYWLTTKLNGRVWMTRIRAISDIEQNDNVKTCIMKFNITHYTQIRPKCVIAIVLNTTNRFD